LKSFQKKCEYSRTESNFKSYTKKAIGEKGRIQKKIAFSKILPQLAWENLQSCRCGFLKRETKFDQNYEAISFLSCCLGNFLFMLVFRWDSIFPFAHPLFMTFCISFFHRSHLRLHTHVIQVCFPCMDNHFEILLDLVGMYSLKARTSEFRRHNKEVHRG
jgi:hypothetical protein